MKIYLLQLVIVAAFLFYSFRMGFSKAAINFIYVTPFYSLAVVDFPGGSYIKPPEIYAAALFVFYLINGSPIKRRPAIFCLIFFLPFVISLLLNYYHFNAIQAWEIDVSKRSEWYDKLIVKRSLDSSNITQLFYIVVALISFLVVSSANVVGKKAYLEKVIGRTIFLVAAIGVFQIATYYTGVYEIYLNIFCNASIFETNELAWSAILGIKRISATFTEPSILGFFLGMSYLLVLMLNEWRFRDLMKKPSIWISFIVGMASLSGTFYFSIIVIVAMYACINIKRANGLFLSVSALAAAMLLAHYVINYMPDYIHQKQGSFDERYLFGVENPLKNFMINPFWGAAFGSDRPTTLVFNLIVSVGAMGVFMILLAVRNIWVEGVKGILIFWLICGVLSPDLNLLFPWVFMGVLYSLYSGRDGILHSMQA